MRFPFAPRSMTLDDLLSCYKFVFSENFPDLGGDNLSRNPWLGSLSPWESLQYYLFVYWDVASTAGDPVGAQHSELLIRLYSRS